MSFGTAQLHAVRVILTSLLFLQSHSCTAWGDFVRKANTHLTQQNLSTTASEQHHHARMQKKMLSVKKIYGCERKVYITFRNRL